MITREDLAGMRRVLTERAALRFWSYIRTNGDCWEWQRSTTVDGYGKTRMDTKMWRTHRLVYTLLVRRLRASEILDHQCKNHRCCNPDHMDVVDQATNTRRGWNAIKLHCIRGHALSGDNVYRSPSTGRRSCRTCAREKRQAA